MSSDTLAILIYGGGVVVTTFFLSIYYGLTDTSWGAEFDQSPLPAAFALLWPIVLPLSIAVLGGKMIGQSLQRRRERIARIRAREDAEMKAALKLLEKEGL